MIDLLAATPPGARLGRVDPPQLLAMRDRGVPIIDIRRPSEWEATGVIAGSRLLDLLRRAGRVRPGWLAGRAGALGGTGDPLVLVCRLAQRTDVLGRYLAGARGYRQVHSPGGRHHLVAGEAAAR